MELKETLANLRIGGTEIHYYVLCPRKLWWYVHGMEQEHATGTTAQENVALGALLHQTSYSDKARKDILIDDLLRLDFTDDGAVHEIKKSKGGPRRACRLPFPNRPECRCRSNRPLRKLGRLALRLQCGHQNRLQGTQALLDRMEGSH